MIEAYCRLHEYGFAHSVEIWNEDKICGGLYGVALGSSFFGESMFSRIPNASKVALVDPCRSAFKMVLFYDRLPNHYDLPDTHGSPSIYRAVYF